MYLSGSVGYTLLKHKYCDKYVFLLADIHDGVNYCKQDSIMIDKWLSLKDNNDILLEELLREKISFTDLWPSSVHTQRLKTLNQNNNKIKPVDIRSLLIPFSWELKLSTNITLEDMLNNINKFFYFKKTKLMVRYIVPEMIKLNNSNDKNIIYGRQLLINHFNEMKQIYIDYITINKQYLNKPLMDLYDNTQLLEQINNITSMIMEWYILLLILNSNNNCILHLGLAHSNRILDFLTKVYLFNVINKSGINAINELNENSPQACLLISDEVNNKFK